MGHDCIASPELVVGLLGTLADMLDYELQPRKHGAEERKVIRALIATCTDDELGQHLLNTQARLQVLSAKWRALLVEANVPLNRMNQMMEAERPAELKRLRLWLDCTVEEVKLRCMDQESKELYGAFSDWLDSEEAKVLLKGAA